MFKSLLSVIAALIVLANPVAHQNVEEIISLQDAVQKGVIQFELHGNESSTHYLKPVVINLENTKETKVVIRINSGLMLQSMDSADQDIVLIGEQIVSLNPHEKMGLPLNGMCIQRNNNAPGANSGYQIKGLAADKLRAWAEEIAKNDWQNVQGQQGMWCLSDGNPEGQMISSGSDEEWKMFSALMKLQGKKAPDKEAFLKLVKNSSTMKASLRGVFKLSLSREVPVHIALFNQHGIVLKEILKEKVPKGKHDIEYTFDAEPYLGETIFAKLIIYDDVLLERKINL